LGNKLEIRSRIARCVVPDSVNLFSGNRKDNKDQIVVNRLSGRSGSRKMASVGSMQISSAYSCLRLLKSFCIRKIPFSSAARMCSLMLKPIIGFTLSKMPARINRILIYLDRLIVLTQCLVEYAKIDIIIERSNRS
jgi:hypothetical protein